MRQATEKAQALVPRLLEDLGDRCDAAQTGAVDENWYWAAPILLDVLRHRGDARTWLTTNRTARLVGGRGGARGGGRRW